METKTILLAGGGTSGHSAPLLPIYKKLLEQNSSLEIFVTGIGSKEEKAFLGKIPNYEKISAGKKQPGFNLKNIAEACRFLQGYFQARAIIKRVKPQIIFSKGGFASFPVVMAANHLEIPYLLHESDIVMGKANKLMAKWAKRVFVCFPINFYREIPPEKLVFAGPILREGFAENDHKELSRYHFSNEAKPVIFLTGGSQGALNLSKKFLEIAINLLPRYNIIHQAGKHSIEISQHFRDSLPEDLKSSYCLKEFFGVEDGIDSMLEAINAADLIVSRAGSTIAELAVKGKAMLLVPWKYSAQNHQEKNAQYFEKNKAARVILEDNLTSESLKKAIDELFSSQDVLRQMSENAKQIFPNDGVDKIVKEIINS